MIESLAGVDTVVLDKTGTLTGQCGQAGLLTLVLDAMDSEQGAVVAGALHRRASGRAAMLLPSSLARFAEGRLQLAAVDTEAGVSGDEVLALAAAAERNTRHPLADALVAAAEARGEPPEQGWGLVCLSCLGVGLAPSLTWS